MVGKLKTGATTAAGMIKKYRDGKKKRGSSSWLPWKAQTSGRPVKSNAAQLVVLENPPKKQRVPPSADPKKKRLAVKRALVKQLKKPAAAQVDGPKNAAGARDGAGQGAGAAGAAGAKAAGEPGAKAGAAGARGPAGAAGAGAAGARGAAGAAGAKAGAAAAKTA